jgi:micrococcal nuclease
MRTVRTYAAIAVVLASVLYTIPTSLSFAQRSTQTTTARSRTPSQAEPRAEVRVLGVVDGDTIEVCCVRGKHEKVRYIGVNTPETKHPGKGVEPLGKEAAEVNRRLVGGHDIRLEFDVEQRDRYGRLLAYVYLEDGTFVNAWLVQNGYAQVMTIPPNVRYQELFLSLQREAREARRGLWGQ